MLLFVSIFCKKVQLTVDVTDFKSNEYYVDVSFLFLKDAFMYRYTLLCNMLVGEKAIVKKVNTLGSMRRRFLDIGLVKDTEIECIGSSPSGDPSAYLIKGAVIAIRADDGKSIEVEIKHIKE